MQNVPLIAIVDDNSHMREALFGLIGSLGFEAQTFGSAEHFLKTAVSRDFDCIILDVAMPGLSGIDLQLELNERGSPPPIIFVTSRDDSATKAAAIKGGATCFLVKPVMDTELIACIRSIFATDNK